MKIREILKFLLLVVIYTVFWIAPMSVMPFSETFRNLPETSPSMVMVLLCNLWFCFTICYIVLHSGWSAKRTIFATTGIMFLVMSFLQQIETLFFGHAFPALTTGDILLLMIGGLFPLIATVPVATKFFHNKNNSFVKSFDKKKMVMSVIMLGFIFLVVYFVFGYFVAWQFEDLRVFYTNKALKLGFWQQLAHNWNTNFMIFPFQIVRGMLLALSAIPLFCMINNKIHFIICVCMMYVAVGVFLIIPNALFPDMVRWAHFIEVTSSMLLFGLITGFILSKISKYQPSEKDI